MTPERRRVLETLGELSALHPEMRVGQWLTMFATFSKGSEVSAIYDAEDEELIPAMERFLAKRRAEAEAVAHAG